MTKLEEQQTQLNVRLDRTDVASAKRLAAKSGIPLNIFIGSLIKSEMAREAVALREQLEAEQEAMLQEKAELMAAIERAEAENEKKFKQRVD